MYAEFFIAGCYDAQKCRPCLLSGKSDNAQAYLDGYYAGRQSKRDPADILAQRNWETASQ